MVRTGSEDRRRIDSAVPDGRSALRLRGIDHVWYCPHSSTITFDLGAVANIEALKTVRAPELPVNLVDLGLIYELVVKQGGEVYVWETAKPARAMRPIHTQQAVFGFDSFPAGVDVNTSSSGKIAEDERPTETTIVPAGSGRGAG